MSKDCGCNCSNEEEKDEKGCCGEHDHEGCGCGHDHGLPMMTLEMENGEEVAAQVLGVFPSGDLEYIALLPEDSEDVYIYRYSEEGEEVVLGQIESDEEYERVGEVFMELIQADDEDETEE